MSGVTSWRPVISSTIFHCFSRGDWFESTYPPPPPVSRLKFFLVLGSTRPFFRVLSWQHAAPGRATANAPHRATVDADSFVQCSKLPLCELCDQLRQSGVDRGRGIANAGASSALLLSFFEIGRSDENDRESLLLNFGVVKSISDKNDNAASAWAVQRPPSTQVVPVCPTHTTAVGHIS